MTVQEAKEFFSGSDFSAETKGKIEAVLANAKELGPNEIEQIRALMQEELDKDFESAGADYSAVPEITAAEAAYAAKTAELETEFAEDAAYVEAELAALDAVRKRVMAVSDTMQAEAIKQGI